MPRINNYGIISGGRAEMKLKARYHREYGAKLYWEELKEKPKCIRINKGWIQIFKSINKHWEKIAFSIGKQYGSDAEIGYLRMEQMLMPLLVKSKRKFREKQMIKWAEDLASFEFGVHMDNPLSILGEGKITCGLIKAVHPDIYDKMKKVAEKLKNKNEA